MTLLRDYVEYTLGARGSQLRGAAFVAVVKSADLGELYDLAMVRRLSRHVTGLCISSDK
jgi:hypothetical protein